MCAQDWTNKCGELAGWPMAALSFVKKDQCLVDVLFWINAFCVLCGVCEESMRDMEREGERARPLGQKNKGVHAALRGRAKREKVRRERERGHSEAPNLSLPLLLMARRTAPTSDLAMKYRLSDHRITSLAPASIRAQHPAPNPAMKELVMKPFTPQGSRPRPRRCPR